MPLLPIVLPPGSGRLVSPEMSRGTWWDMSLVRWHGGVLSPIGGWVTLPGMQLDGAVRNILSWRDNETQRWVGAASLSQIQAWDGLQGTVISPADFVAGAPAGATDGYGIGDYGEDVYGTPRATGSAVFRAGPTDSVSLDNWGEDLMAMGSADGRLLQWTPVLPVTTNLVPVLNAPAGRTFIVTDERHVMILGADGDPRRLSWCSQENPTDWLPTVINTAGSLQVRSTGIGLALRRVAQGVLVFCDDDIHLANYLGPPYVYGLNRIGTGCGPIGPEAMVAMTGRAVWMGQQSFWLYNGGVQPLPCPIEAYIFSDINEGSQSETFGFHNGIFPEVTWFYPDASGLLPNSYVTWDYEANVWWHGKLERSIGCEPGALGLPLLGDAEGFVYQHEDGWLANGEQRGAAVYAESGSIELGEGDRGTVVRAMLPDVRQPELVQFHMFGRWEPNDTVHEDYGAFTLDRKDGIIDMLFEARAIRMRIEGVLDGPWQVGRMRLDVKAGSGR